MKTSLYLMEYQKETIKNEPYYRLTFFDSINGLIFKTYIHEKNLLNDYIGLIDNGTPKVLENLRKEVKYE